MITFISASLMFYQSFLNFNIPTQNYYSNRIKPIMQITDHVTSSKSRLNNDNLFNDNSVLIQGGSLRTWSYRSQATQQVQAVISSEGRPVDADIELWNGPDNTPLKMRVYVENGRLRPFSCVIDTPRGPNTIAIRNIGQYEFPMMATTFVENVDNPTRDCLECSQTIQGGALRTYPFDPSVESVEVLIKTDGRPLNARIEVLQGPNNNKEVIEVYTEDGYDRPFYCVLDTPGSGNVIRIVNTAPMEFPMSASAIPYSINNNAYINRG